MATPRPGAELADRSPGEKIRPGDRPWGFTPEAERRTDELCGGPIVGYCGVFIISNPTRRFSQGRIVAYARVIGLSPDSHPEIVDRLQRNG